MARITESLELERQIPRSDVAASGRACRTRIPDALRRGELVPCRGCHALIRRTRENAMLDPLPDAYCANCKHVTADLRQEHRTGLELVQSQLKGMAAEGFLKELKEDDPIQTLMNKPKTKPCVICAKPVAPAKGNPDTCSPPCSEESRERKTKARKAAKRNTTT